MIISLRPGEKIYVNGAVLRVDRKVSLELLNDVTFLLESHVLQPEQATTPLRQLYFVVQTILMEPGEALAARDMFRTLHGVLVGTFERQDVLAGLAAVERQVGAGRPFDALKSLRALFPIEDAILRHSAGEVSPCAA
ncbi:flagellar biosynthesis repressor FlbT [Propylenella binzhouense]|uniref:Probable flagellum biosynthesis repressor protein FlbT n=1 Tax=Propylenella binzhouense TaxID=2555902 RepID=A0A964T1X9_9HYPH|nr:flagellar biosynthesis repressor FlbT [Propylenella binzhouense]MYZ46961.1 flagellar biosynthesis repressor FlbT [Propylenella binzhouense]